MEYEDIQDEVTPGEETPKDTQPEEGKDEPSLEEDINYWKSEAERERKRREKAEKALGNDRYEAKELKDKLEKAEEGKLTKAEIDQMLDEREKKITLRITRNQARAKFDEIAVSPDHADLLMEYYENRVPLTGDFDEDIAMTIAVVNNKRGIPDSIRKAAMSKLNKSSGGDAGARIEKTEQKPKVSPEDAKFLSHYAKYGVETKN